VVKYRVGHVEVLPQHNKIISEGEVIRLEPKIMQVLEHLIIHKGEVLSREQIIQSLWPEQVVGHEVITRAIFELRKYFRDDPKHPSFIETIPRKGYCFVHEYEVNEPLPEQAAKRAKPPKLLATMSIAVCITVWLMLNFAQFTPEEVANDTTTDIETILLENSAERISDHQLSPEQSTVVYIRQQGDFWLLKTLNLETLHKSVIVESKRSLRSPRWITENRIVYLKCGEEHCDVIEKNLTHNKQRLLHRTPKRLIRMDIDAVSQKLVAEVAVKEGRYLQLYSLETKQELNTVNLPHRSVSKPRFSSDTLKLFFISTIKFENPTIHQWHIEQESITHSVDIFNRIFDYTEIDHNRLLVAGRKQGQTGIWLVDIQSNSHTLLIPSAISEVISAVDAHGEGRKLIFSAIERDIDTYINGDNALIKAMNSSMIDMNAIWATEQKKLFYVSNRSGSYEMWQTDKLGASKLTTLNANLLHRPILSNDGKLLAFVSPLKAKSQIHIAKLGNKITISTAELLGEIQLLAWSHDNKYIYYSAYERGNYHIFKYSLETKYTEPIIVSAGFMLHEDVNTNDFYYIDTQEKRLMRQTKEGEIQQLSSTLKGAERLKPLQATVDNGALYYIATKAGLPTLTMYNISSGTYQDLDTLPAGAYVTQIVKHEEKWMAIYDLTHPDKSRLYQSTIKMTEKPDK